MLSMPLLLAERWAESVVTQFLRGARRMNPPASSYSSTLGFTNRTEPLQSSSLRVLSVENRPAVSTGVGQVSRRPAGPFRQPCLPGIRAQ